jgi:hypothetical protein
MRNQCHSLETCHGRAGHCSGMLSKSPSPPEMSAQWKSLKAGSCNFNQNAYDGTSPKGIAASGFLSKPETICSKCRVAAGSFLHCRIYVRCFESQGFHVLSLTVISQISWQVVLRIIMCDCSPPYGSSISVFLRCSAPSDLTASDCT